MELFFRFEFVPTACCSVAGQSVRNLWKHFLYSPIRYFYTLIRPPQAFSFQVKQVQLSQPLLISVISIFYIKTGGLSKRCALVQPQIIKFKCREYKVIFVM